MRILNLDGTHFVRQFREMGHDVLSLGFPEYGGPYDVELSRPLYHRGLLEILRARNFEPDVVLWNDKGYPPRILGFEALPAVTLGFSIDQFCNPWHVPFSAAFDAVFVSQKDLLPVFLDPGLERPAYWLPLFCNPSRDQDKDMARDIPVSFVGTLRPILNPDREVFLREFKKLSPLVVTQGQYVEIFNRSRVVLNQSVASELNFRVFEAAGCGAAVLTESIEHGLMDLFTPGENILPTYPRGDVAAASAIARDWLSRPEDLARLARAGRDLVHSRHTVAIRAETILSVARELIGKDRQRLRQPERVRVYMEMACGFIAGETDSCLPPEVVEHYRLLAETYGRVWDKI